MPPRSVKRSPPASCSASDDLLPEFGKRIVGGEADPQWRRPSRWVGAAARRAWVRFVGAPTVARLRWRCGHPDDPYRRDPRGDPPERHPGGGAAGLPVDPCLHHRGRVEPVDPGPRVRGAAEPGHAAPRVRPRPGGAGVRVPRPSRRAAAAGRGHPLRAQPAGPDGRGGGRGGRPDRHVRPRGSLLRGHAGPGPDERGGRAGTGTDLGERDHRHLQLPARHPPGWGQRAALPDLGSVGFRAAWHRRGRVGRPRRGPAHAAVPIGAVAGDGGPARAAGVRGGRSRGRHALDGRDPRSCVQSTCARGPAR